MNFDKLIFSIEFADDHFKQQASKAVNVSLTLRNWLIGYYIVEFEQQGEDRAKYGEKVIDELSKRLGHIKGVDRRSLFRFKEFYKIYPQIAEVFAKNQGGYFDGVFNDNLIVGLAIPQLTSSEKVGSVTPQLGRSQVPVTKLVGKLSYTHFEQLLSIDDDLKRVFYEVSCINGTWSVMELKRQINSLFYERSGLSKKPELLAELTDSKVEVGSPAAFVKSVYAFEFLGLKAKDAVEENDLETSLLDHLQEFIMEMGHGFCLEARQKKILIGDEYFFVDLVFYHRILRCHVLVELKVEDFNHHNIGQLNTYVNYYKAEVMLPDDNPTVGILLVTNKNNALVEYATAGMDNQLFVSKYLLELPNKEQLQAFINNELKKWNNQ